MIILGDCIKVLPTLDEKSVSLIYTDPPYELKYKSNIPGNKTWNKSGITTSAFDVIAGDSGGINWQLVWSECFRVLKDNSFLFIHANIPFIMNYGNLIKESGFIYKGTVAWNKRFAIGGGIETSMKRDWEPILYYSKGTAKFKPIEVVRKQEVVTRKRISEIADWEFSLKNKEKMGHPTQKPLDLAKQVINLTTEEGSCVLDPFAGSGTIGKAAKQLNRESISIEISETFYNLIKGE